MDEGAERFRGLWEDEMCARQLPTKSRVGRGTGSLIASKSLIASVIDYGVGDSLD